MGVDEKTVLISNEHLAQSREQNQSVYPGYTTIKSVNFTSGVDVGPYSDNFSENNIVEWLNDLTNYINRNDFMRRNIFLYILDYVKKNRLRSGTHLRLTMYKPQRVVELCLKGHQFELPYPLRTLTQNLYDDRRIYSQIHLTGELQDSRLNIDREGNEVHLCIYINIKNYMDTFGHYYKSSCDHDEEPCCIIL